MARWSGASWNGDGVPAGGAFASGRPQAVTLHHQVGWGDPRGVYIARRVSAHFWIPEQQGRRPVQHVDTAIQAWHGRNHNPWSLGVETEGCGRAPHADPLTPWQIEQFAQLMAWANRTHGVPLRISNHVTTAGLNFHNAPGFDSATACPCAVRRDARQRILDRAAEILRPSPPPVPPPARPAEFMPNGEEPTVNIVFGDDNQAGIGLPNNVTHIRLTCSQGATVHVQFPGTTTATRAFELQRHQRADVPIPSDQQGQVILRRENARGPIYMSWMVPRVG